MKPGGLGRPVGVEEAVAPAQKLLRAGAVQNDAGVDGGADGESRPARYVRFDEARDDVRRRPLGGHDQMDGGGPAQLGDAADAVLHLVGGHHHQVGQLVDDHHDPGQFMNIWHTINSTIPYTYQANGKRN